jgi:hypothetical protein
LFSRADARQLLQGKPMGSFLVRTSANVQGAYVVSHVDSDRNGAVSHVLVRPVGEGRWQPQGDATTYASMTDVVAQFFAASK